MDVFTALSIIPINKLFFWDAVFQHQKRFYWQKVQSFKPSSSLYSLTATRPTECLSGSGWKRLVFIPGLKNIAFSSIDSKYIFLSCSSLVESNDDDDELNRSGNLDESGKSEADGSRETDVLSDADRLNDADVLSDPDNLNNADVVSIGADELNEADEMNDDSVPAAEKLFLRNRTSAKGRSTEPPEQKTDVQKLKKVVEKPKIKNDDGDGVSDKTSATFMPDFSKAELWKAEDQWHLIQHYRKKSTKANKRFVSHEQQLPHDHHRDPEDQAYIDAIDSVNEPALDLAEEALVEAAAEIQRQKKQHEKVFGEALAKIEELKKMVQDGQAVANATFKEVVAGRAVANVTYDLTVNNSKALQECLGRPTLEMWVAQGWDALWGKVPASESFFRPVSIGQWFEPQVLAMGLIWIVSFFDNRSGSKLSRFLNVHTPGWAKVFNSILHMRHIPQDFNLLACIKSLCCSIRLQMCWCDFNSFKLSLIFFFTI